MNIYGIKDVIADEIVGVFLAKNDLVACRMNLKQPDGINPDDFEIVNLGVVNSTGSYPIVSRLSHVNEKLGVLLNTVKED